MGKFQMLNVMNANDPADSKTLLLDKLEKNGTSPKTWYRAIFQIGKFEMVANQNDPAEIGRKRSRKFLQFLENFSGDIYTGGSRNAKG
jgi:hypothetical protein